MTTRKDYDGHPLFGIAVALALVAPFWVAVGIWILS